MVRTKEICLDVVMSGMLLCNVGVVIEFIWFHDVGQLSGIVPNASWALFLFFLTTALILFLVAETDLPRTIRESVNLKTQLRLLYVSQYLLSIAFFSDSTQFFVLPRIATIIAGGLLMLLSASAVLRNLLRAENR